MASMQVSGVVEMPKDEATATGVASDGPIEGLGFRVWGLGFRSSKSQIVMVRCV